MELEKFLKYLEEIERINYLITTLKWEMDTVAPEKSLDYLINTSTFLEMKSFKLMTNKKYIELIENLINSNEYKKLSEEEKIYINDIKENYYKFKKVPKKFYQEFCTLKKNSLNAWIKAKEKNDYELFKPYLKKIIDYTKKYYRYMYDNPTNLYDCMLNDYEKNINSEFIDKLFSNLKKELIPIIKEIKIEDKSKINIHLEDSKFISFAKLLLDYIGFDNSRGSLGIYTHGYTTKLNNNDIRITFSNRDNPIDSISTIIHEGGHGIFDQNIGSNLSKYGIYEVNKYALHESQSRFYENMLGRRKSFYEPIYDEIKKYLNIDMPIDEFVSYFNLVRPSLVRTEADELTYPMHIIIRYEIERDIFNDNLDLDNLKEIWNKKYQEYLGVSSIDDKNGIIQDMHWSDGSFGYFPSYLLESIFDGMLLELMNEEVGNIDQLLKNGKIKEITNYLNKNIHKYGGSYNINEVANRLFGKDLDITPLINYYKSKYK